MRVLLAILAAAAVVESFVTPNNHYGMVKRIIDSTSNNRIIDQEKIRHEQSLLCDGGAFGYCNSFGYVEYL